MGEKAEKPDSKIRLLVCCGEVSPKKLSAMKLPAAKKAFQPYGTGMVMKGRSPVLSGLGITKVVARLNIGILSILSTPSSSSPPSIRAKMLDMKPVSTMPIAMPLKVLGLDTMSLPILAEPWMAGLKNRYKLRINLDEPRKLKLTVISPAY